MRLFHATSDEEICKGETNDVHFVWIKEKLLAKGLEQTKAVSEVTSGYLLQNWSGRILCGVEELANLFRMHARISVELAECISFVYFCS
ncbi:hypothetical protein KAU25_00075 [Candidatus Bathyarchaeota archaeon]|nr:hypothetical protein [Candidatus Bathyarchaeota archaeon]